MCPSFTFSSPLFTEGVNVRVVHHLHSFTIKQTTPGEGDGRQAVPYRIHSLLQIIIRRSKSTTSSISHFHIINCCFNKHGMTDWCHNQLCDLFSRCYIKRLIAMIEEQTFHLSPKVRVYDTSANAYSMLQR